MWTLLRVHLQKIMIQQICEYISNDLTLMDTNFTLRNSSGHKGKEKTDPDPNLWVYVPLSS